ncbi:hypothetical protein niasHT_033203 [Heterodera trifolii]|uniref:Uncharacterized protein n=1 Tax=Heterodera trifolii TaxID=157864 RepID=A0ABD2I4G9_9BILA
MTAVEEEEEEVRGWERKKRKIWEEGNGEDKRWANMGRIGCADRGRLSDGMRSHQQQRWSLSAGIRTTEQCQTEYRWAKDMEEKIYTGKHKVAEPNGADGYNWEVMELANIDSGGLGRGQISGATRFLFSRTSMGAKWCGLIKSQIKSNPPEQQGHLHHFCDPSAAAEEQHKNLLCTNITGSIYWAYPRPRTERGRKGIIRTSKMKMKMMMMMVPSRPSRDSRPHRRLPT